MDSISYCNYYQHLSTWNRLTLFLVQQFCKVANPLYLVLFENHVWTTAVHWVVRSLGFKSSGEVFSQSASYSEGWKPTWTNFTQFRYFSTLLTGLKWVGFIQTYFHATEGILQQDWLSIKSDQYDARTVQMRLFSWVLSGYLIINYIYKCFLLLFFADEYLS